MSIRKTKAISFNISSGTFKTYDEAIREANAIKIWLKRLCNKNGYSCKALIGISQHNPKAGEVKLKKSGIGRPKVRFERTSFFYIKTNAEPHIHIVLYANPADMIASLLQKRLNKKFKLKVCWVNNCEEYVEEAVDYAIRQSLKLRTVEVDKAGILKDDTLGFYAAVEAANRRAEGKRIVFTYSESKKSQKSQDISNVSQENNKQKKLQCNSYNMLTNIGKETCKVKDTWNKYFFYAYTNRILFHLKRKVLSYMGIKYIPP